MPCTQVYLVDRTIAISTGTPVCVSDEHITTPLPSVDPSSTSADAGPNVNQFLSQLKICQLQSEIYEIKFFDRSVPDRFTTHADWVRHIEDRIAQTLNPANSANGVVPQWVSNAAHLCRNLLHRPHPGNMEPSRDSLVAATASAIELINGYYRTIRTSRLIRAFSVVDNAFQAAIVLLYISGNYASVVRDASLEEELVSAIENAITILVSVA